MKLSPQDREIMDRMAPGVYCRDGFLGDDRRPLGEILDADRSAVEDAGTTHERIAAALAAILNQAEPACGAPVHVAGNLTATFTEGMGRIPCPWGDGIFHKGEVELTDAAGAVVARFTPLSVHLIAAHGFYQGRGGPYRLDPAAIAELLAVPPSPGPSIP
jgi:hypothetical protein